MTGNQNHSILAHLAVFGRVLGVVSVLEIMVWVGEVIWCPCFLDHRVLPTQDPVP